MSFLQIIKESDGQFSSRRTIAVAFAVSAIIGAFTGMGIEQLQALLSACAAMLFWTTGESVAALFKK